MISSKYKDAADEELCRLAVTDEAAYSELLSRYLPSVRRAAAIYQQSPADRDDLVSEGILGLMAAVKTFSPDKGAKFSTYALVCANRRILNSLKKISRIKGNEDYSDEPEPDANPSPEKIVLDREYISEIFAEVSSNSFSELEQSVLNLYLSGEPYDNIAGMLKIDRKAVDNALARVRRKLRRKFR